MAENPKKEYWKRLWWQAYENTLEAKMSIKEAMEAMDELASKGGVPIRPEELTLPEFIEGKAKGTLIELSYTKDYYLTTDEKLIERIIQGAVKRKPR